MTIEEAIKVLKEGGLTLKECEEAFDMAINALKAIDEIKTEIENLPTGVELTDGSIREFAFKNYKKGLLKIIDEKVKENKK